MNTIIGRDLEKLELNDAYASNHAEFIAIYGRRRVGKTYLVKNFFQAKKGVYFQMTGIYNGPVKEQLTRFSKELSTTFYPGAAIGVPTSWMAAFEALTHAMSQTPKNKKIILFFDELPWMATKKSGAIRALEYFWNRHWENDNRLKLIVCGSAASWIIHKIIKNRGGLHNRITRKIRLTPFNLKETYLFLQYINYPCNQQQCLKLYMITGGVPFYLKQLKSNLSIEQNTSNLFFNSDGIFFDEFDEIFSSLFECAEQYKELVIIIASCKDGIARNILDEKNKLTGAGGRLTKRLEDLEHAGFITSYLSYGHKKRGIYYRLSDEYCYFYLKWIEPIKIQLKQGGAKNYWKNNCNTPEYFGWLGYAFENICYKHLPQIKKTLGIDESSIASPWRYSSKKGSQEQGAQIDLLFDRYDDALTLCEIKYTEKPFIIDKQYAETLKQKITVFKKITQTKKQLFLAIITANGLKKTMYVDEMVNGLVTLNSLF